MIMPNISFLLFSSTDGQIHHFKLQELFSLKTRNIFTEYLAIFFLIYSWAPLEIE